MEPYIQRSTNIKMTGPLVHLDNQIPFSRKNGIIFNFN